MTKTNFFNKLCVSENILESNMKNLLLGMSMLLETSKRLTETASKVNEVLESIVGPCLSVLGLFAVIYVIFLGVQYAKSESDEKRAENKKRMINTLIGAIVLILLITLCYAISWDKLIPQMFGYMKGADA